MSRQFKSARLAALFGAGAFVGGMLYGTQIGLAPEPELALGAHVQWMMAGIISICASAVLANESLCQLNSRPALLTIVDIATYLNWMPSISESIVAFRRQGMPIISKRYGIKWEGNDTIFQVGFHYIPGVILMVSWMIILYGIKSAKSQVGKTK